MAELGGLHIAVNNAGINKNAAAEDCKEADWDLTFDLNTKGVFLCCQVSHRASHYQHCVRALSTCSCLMPVVAGCANCYTVAYHKMQACYDSCFASEYKHIMFGMFGTDT